MNGACNLGRIEYNGNLEAISRESLQPITIMESITEGLSKIEFALEDAEKVVRALQELRKETTEEDWEKMEEVHKGFLMELLDAASDLEASMEMTDLDEE